MTQTFASWTRRLAALGRDRRSGASEIAQRARAVLWEALQAKVPPERLAEAGARLIAGQPAMAPLYRVVNDACLGTLDRRGRRKAVSLRPILVRGGARVLTYSASSTVQQALFAARGVVKEVVCSEGRPGREGARLARALARAGLRVRLLTDAALFRRLGEVDLVLVGADALTASGVVNKIGTRTLATLARLARRPFYVIAETDKILPARLARFFHLPSRPPDALFDRTPYRLVTGIVTEVGVLTREGEASDGGREGIRGAGPSSRGSRGSRGSPP